MISATFSPSPAEGHSPPRPVCLRSMQKALGAGLFLRRADGTLQLTSAGERAALQAERIEREICGLASAVSGVDDTAAGTVRLTAVPIIVNHILLPAAPALLKRYPALNLELIGNARDLSLTRRETDLALRLARPKTGGTRLTARRIGTMRYEAYASASCSPHEAGAMPWITYDEAMAHLPQAQWIAARAAEAGEMIASVRVNDAEAVLEAVLSGLGRSLLPSAIADADARLQRLNCSARIPLPSRELWLIAHRELRALGRIEAVTEWVRQVGPR